MSHTVCYSLTRLKCKFDKVANLVSSNGDVSVSSKSEPVNKSLFCTITYWLYVVQQVCVNVGYSAGVIYVVIGHEYISGINFYF